MEWECPAGLVLGAGVVRNPAHTEAAMGLLSGDTLGSLAVAVLIFSLLLDLMHRRSRWAARYPPGPTPLPVLGNLLQVDFEDPRPSFSQVRTEGWGVLSGGPRAPSSSRQRALGEATGRKRNWATKRKWV